MWDRLVAGDTELLQSLEAMPRGELYAVVEVAVAQQLEQGGKPQSVRGALFRIAYQSTLSGRCELGRALYQGGWEVDPDLGLEGVAPMHRPHAVSHNPTIQKKIEQISENAKIVYITGCARSGTTLAIRCVGGTARQASVLWREHWISAILELEGAETIVVKRSGVDHRFFKFVPSAARVLHVVRHPADTCTSRMPGRDGYYVSPERWLAEHECAKRLLLSHPADRLMVMRYEDLLAQPDLIQSEIGSRWQVDFDLPFSQYQLRNDRDTSIDRDGRPYVWGAVDANAAYRHLKTDKDASRIAEFTAALGPAYAEFCDMFGYNVHPGFR